MTSASILVVDSDPQARARIAEELRQLGYKVCESDAVIEDVPLDGAPLSDAITAGGISIDTIGQRVIVDGDFVNLAPREYQLLLYLLMNQDRVFSRKQLLARVWTREASVGSRTVDVHIRRLRSVLEPYGYARYLQTVRGAGYRFSLKS